MEDPRLAELLLPADLLRRCRDRAADYDAANSFCAADFDELRVAHYLAAAAPTEFGGGGASLDTLVAAQRLLAAHAPATALAVNMHLVWAQTARFLHDRGIATLDWVLRETVAGEVFAFGVSEAGNDAVLLDAHTIAQPQPDGGYLVTGTKTFTTLSPVWTRLGIHARVTPTTPPDEPQLVFGFVRRNNATNDGLDAGTIEHPGRWNPLGMRATQSYTTRLNQTRIAPTDIAATMRPFDSGHPLVLAIFSSFSILTAAVYAGIADRALELAAQAANQPVAPGDASELLRIDDPDTAARLTAATLEHHASLDALTILARDIDEQRGRTDWLFALAAARNRVTDEARSAVEVALRTVGARSYQADSELARLYRDVLAGMFHPSSSRALTQTVRDTLRQPN